MSETAIRIEGLGKRYRLGTERYTTLRETLSRVAASPWRRAPVAEDHGTLWALRDVSLTVARGEVVGVIGRNGAGKSTLLKVLSRITEPTEGFAEIHGRVGSLLEVGTGFHPELTARENIYLSGAILGMRRAEIERKFDDIVAFAEVETFVDTPVKRYSSGMYVRLAFAVAAHLEPEILLVDEVLAVGDHAFQQKCLGRMGDIRGLGRTILLVSHNMASIQALCDRVVLLDHGRAVRSGPAAEMVQAYVDRWVRVAGRVDLTDHPARWRGGRPIFRSLQLLDAEGHETSAFPAGAPFTVRLELDGRASRRSQVWIGVQNEIGQRLFSVSTAFTSDPPRLARDPAVLCCRIPELALVPRQYSLTVWVEVDGRKLDLIEPATAFTVTAADYFGTGRLPYAAQGPFLVRSIWTADPA